MQTFFQRGGNEALKMHITTSHKFYHISTYICCANIIDLAKGKHGPLNIIMQHTSSLYYIYATVYYTHNKMYDSSEDIFGLFILLIKRAISCKNIVFLLMCRNKGICFVLYCNNIQHYQSFAYKKGKEIECEHI